ncbi:hypothetical protein FRC04_006049 [Tulasnella sp. 424]|nr:hypothetical protein FRC04_006049 [Tulasnella sp. 424]
MEPNPKVSSSPFDRIPVEIVIKIVRLSLLQVDYYPVVIMRRVEELRLVNTYWARCIDQCPTFWTHITSQATPERYTRWLEKSQNVPLHMDCRTDDGFMELLVPHMDRWQSLTFFSSSPDAWADLARPAPQLQELDLHNLPYQNSPAELFQGVVPRLKTVRLYWSRVPWHSSIFRAGRLPTSAEIVTLARSASVKSVEAFRYSGTSSNLDPVTLPSLRSLVFNSASLSLLGLIRIPNCTSTSIEYPLFKPLLSEFPWAALIDTLRLTAAVDIRLYPTKLSIATKLGVSPCLNVIATSIPSAQTMLIDLLREAELSQPLPTAVDLSIESPDAAPPILDFLAKPTESGSKRLPKLWRLYLKQPRVSVETVAGLILDHEKLRSVLRSRPLTIGEGWSRPVDIKNRVLDAPLQQRWLR